MLEKRVGKVGGLWGLCGMRLGGGPAVRTVKIKGGKVGGPEADIRGKGPSREMEQRGGKRGSVLKRMSGETRKKSNGEEMGIRAAGTEEGEKGRQSPEGNRPKHTLKKEGKQNERHRRLHSLDGLAKAKNRS